MFGCAPSARGGVNTSMAFSVFQSPLRSVDNSTRRSEIFTPRAQNKSRQNSRYRCDSMVGCPTTTWSRCPTSSAMHFLQRAIRPGE
eukprot:8470009-Pyramimonas_sp.AAC.1